MTWKNNTIIQGDSWQLSEQLEDESVNCVVTSPPYWGLRDYGVAGQIGGESTPEEYVARVGAVFREARRVLREDLALRADGWYLRSDIIWHKPNPTPESVTDRPTRAHEYVFLLSKSPAYYYDVDAVREPHASRYSADAIRLAGRAGGPRPAGENI